MSSTSEQHRSRFGFHPCRFETFQKLRFLKKHYWTTLRQFHTWHRWYCKEPQNRHGAEPTFCKAYVEEKTWFKPKASCGIKVYPKTVVDYEMIQRFEFARRPSDQPVSPFSELELAEINALYRKVTEHFDVTDD